MRRERKLAKMIGKRRKRAGSFIVQRGSLLSYASCLYASSGRLMQADSGIQGLQASSDDQISKAKLSTAYRASFCFVHTAARLEQFKSRQMAVVVKPSCSKNFNQIASGIESLEPPAAMINPFSLDRRVRPCVWSYSKNSRFQG